MIGRRMLWCLGLLAAMPCPGMTQHPPTASRPADLPAFIDRVVDLVPGDKAALKKKLSPPRSAPPHGGVTYRLKSGQRLFVDIKSTTNALVVEQVEIWPIDNTCVDRSWLIDTLIANGQTAWHPYPSSSRYFGTVLHGKLVYVRGAPNSQCIEAIVINKAVPPMKPVGIRWPVTHLEAPTR